jgi:chromosome segregation ATPase
LQASIQIPYHACPMSVHTPDHEPSLFDPKPVVVDAAKAPEPPPVSSASAAAPSGADAGDERPEESAEESAAEESASVASDEQDSPRNDRKRLAEQLDALRKKEAELLRALAITDHPDLADAIRTIEARVYCVARADAKLAQGLSKSEARRQEVLTKKLSGLREKRAELDTQIDQLEAEFQELGAARMTDFQRERQDALQDLMVALATHDPALDAAGVDVRNLLPELGGLLPELESIARAVSTPRADA